MCFVFLKAIASNARSMTLRLYCKILGLRIRHGDRALRARVPVNKAGHISDEAPGDGELSSPVGVDVGVEGSMSARSKKERGRGRVAEIKEDAKSSAIMKRTRITDKSSQLGSNVGKIRASNIGEPKISADKGHVVFAMGGHRVVLRRIRGGTLVCGEYSCSIVRGVEATRE